MIKKAAAWISWPVVIVLLFFTARRWLFTLVALLSRGSRSESTDPAANHLSVLMLVPIRNEAETLPGLLTALDNLEYADHTLTTVFVNDASTDNSETILQTWTTYRANRHLLSLPQNVGKASALNVALAKFPAGEIVVIYDADERPRPDALQHLTRPFADDRVGGVSGRRAVSNPLAGPAAGYATFESLVHQLITMRAKDRLNLAPALLGANCAYRRAALAGAGNFKPGVLLEDSDLTLKLTRAGWKLRFEPLAISCHRVPQTMSGYWKQHTRWARGFNEVAKEQGRQALFDRQLSALARLELFAFSLGYLDRLALLIALALTLTKNRLAAWGVAISLLTPLLQVLAALKIAQAPPALRQRVLWLPFFFVVDAAMAVNGFWSTVRQTPQIWEERRDRK